MSWSSIVIIVLILLAGCGGDDSDGGDAVAGATRTQTESITQDADATATSEPTPTQEPTESPLPTSTPTPSPTPTETPTPEPTATLTSTSTPTTVPLPTPVPEPKVYQGDGTDVVSIEKPDPDGPALVYVRGNAAERYFGVTGFNAAGEQLELLVNTTDPYEGVVPLDFRSGDQTTRLQVEAEGEWYIEVRPLLSARRVEAPGTISGAGDDVFIASGTFDTAHIVGNAAERYFGVHVYTDRSDLLVNTTSQYDGRVIVPNETSVYQVTAVGDWTITFE